MYTTCGPTKYGCTWTLLQTSFSSGTIFTADCLQPFRQSQNKSSATRQTAATRALGSRIKDLPAPQRRLRHRFSTKHSDAAPIRSFATKFAASQQNRSFATKRSLLFSDFCHAEMGGCSTAHTSRLVITSRPQTSIKDIRNLSTSYQRSTFSNDTRNCQNKEGLVTHPLPFQSFPSTLALTWRGAQPRVPCGPSNRLSLRFSNHQETLTRKSLYFMLSVLIPILTS